MTSNHPPIESIVFSTLRQLGEDFDLPALREVTLSTTLFGEGGVLDSMSLVHLIADLEEAVSESSGKTLILADERAMSARQSPFRTPETLIAAIHERL
jgi:acyl carrier protein